MPVVPLSKAVSRTVLPESRAAPFGVSATVSPLSAWTVVVVVVLALTVKVSEPQALVLAALLLSPL